MASWEDGPEYAPLERPAEFAVAPATQALEVVPPPARPAAGAPKDRPAFDGPEVPVPPLADLVPVVDDQRDPATPFDVAASSLTSMDSAWGAAHWSSPTGGTGPAVAPLTAPTAPPAPGPAPYPAAQPHGGAQPYLDRPSAEPAPSTGYPAAAGGYPPATAWPPPTSPLPSVSGPAQLPGGFPPPGTPQWFGPGPGQPQQPPAQGPVRLGDVVTAATPGLVICLVVGCVLWFLAPIMLGVGFVLSTRIRVAQDAIRKVFLFALGFLGFFALAGLLNFPTGFADWWSFVGIWALAICWILLVTVLALVYRGLKSGRTAPPRAPSGWAGP